MTKLKSKVEINVSELFIDCYNKKCEHFNIKKICHCHLVWFVGFFNNKCKKLKREKV